MSELYQIEVKDSLNPLLLTFPQNMPQDINNLLSNTQLFQQDIAIKPRKAIKISSDKVTWVGKSQINNSLEPQLLIGLIDSGKNQGKMTLIPSQASFKMQQFVHKQVGAGRSLLTANTNDKNFTHFEKQMMVAEEMGTSKSRRKMRAMETNRVQQENISHATQIQEIFEQQKEELKAKVEQDKQENKQYAVFAKQDILPTFNPKEDKNPANIYDISSIVSDTDLEAINISGLYVAVTKKPENLSTATKRFSQFTQEVIMEIMEPLQQRNNTEKIMTLKYIVFLDTMIKFSQHQKFLNSSIENIAMKLKVSELTLVRSILSKFYTATVGQDKQLSYSRSQLLTDKLMCYIIVLTLHIYDYTVETLKLINALKINLNKFLLYSKHCGCTVLHQGNAEKMQIKLKVPSKNE